MLVGYWGTGLLYRGPSRALEARLESIDRELFTWFGCHAFTLPRAVRELLEFAYLCCYPLVPAGMAVLYVMHRRSLADAYWTIVVTSAFLAYAVLPWAGTRPPRSIETPREGRPGCFFQRVNLTVLAHGSIQVNTFPSGHAASAWAVALFLSLVPGAPWPAFALFAAAIGVGAVRGRYHYGLDVVTGVLVAVAVFVWAGL